MNAAEVASPKSMFIPRQHPSQAQAEEEARSQQRTEGEEKARVPFSVDAVHDDDSLGIPCMGL